MTTTQPRDFCNIYRHGLVRVAACTVRTAIAEPQANAEAILQAATACSEAGVAVSVFPELGLSGYAIDDLLQQDALLDAVEAALGGLAAATAGLLPLLLVGAPLRQQGRLFNCAVALHRGAILGVVPKSYLPNYREFYERRHFAAGGAVREAEIGVAGRSVPFGCDLLFAAADLADLVVHAEICEDLWTAIPPSGTAALAGASLLLNLSASNITIGKAETRRMLCLSQSARCIAAYAYAASGAGESTTDLAWDGQAAIFENGEQLAETERFALAPTPAIADIDLDRLRQERLRVGTFNDNRQEHAAPFRRIGFTLAPPDGDLGLRRNVARFPYVPDEPARRDQDCYEAFNIQVHALVQRLRATATRNIVIGVSGGLDSTHALIVAAKALDLLGLPRTNLLGFTLPGFATGATTRGHAHALMAALGITAAELDIRPAARLLLADIGHPYANGVAQYDITFENVQAGLRTDYLFRLANQRDAIVLGTGDMSELALGWCTYGVGDQMSHYGVNAGVPKTLIQHLIRWVAQTRQFADPVPATLLAILATEISPELVPAEAGSALQSTQQRIGPYELQDFNLFYTLRWGLRPSKIAFLAWHAWHDAAAGRWPAGIAADARSQYDLATIKRWLEVFLYRFFTTSQFKRSALPNGPKVSAGGALSPRGDWRAPSDGNARLWLAELRDNVPDA
jgi:NAD+ synthase (glutamine-hydrolysing)